MFFLAALFDMAGVKLVGNAGGTVLFNSPHAIIVSHLLVCLVFMFVGAAFTRLLSSAARPYRPER